MQQMGKNNSNNNKHQLSTHLKAIEIISTSQSQPVALYYLMRKFGQPLGPTKKIIGELSRRSLVIIEYVPLSAKRKANKRIGMIMQLTEMGLQSLQAWREIKALFPDENFLMN
jgi:hypothetical protein